MEAVGIGESESEHDDDGNREPVHETSGLLDRDALDRVGHRLEGVDGCLQGLDDDPNSGALVMQAIVAAGSSIDDEAFRLDELLAWADRDGLD